VIDGVVVDEGGAVFVEAVVEFFVDGVEVEDCGGWEAEGELEEEGWVAEEGFVDVEGLGGGMLWLWIESVFEAVAMAIEDSGVSRDVGLVGRIIF
jgi:hypothetical protein